MGTTVRKLGPEDLARVAAIQAESPEASGWKVEEYLEQESRVLEVDGELVGFAVSRAVLEGQEYELLNMAIASQYRGRGLGKALIEKLTEEYKGVWFLEVRESNERARRVYEWAGFRVVRRRPNYYSDPAEDALEMTKLS